MDEELDFDDALEALKTAGATRPACLARRTPAAARLWAAEALAAKGAAGARALYEIARDPTVHEDTKLVALQHLDIGYLETGVVEPLLREFVEGNVVWLQITAMQKIGQFELRSLTKVVERRCDSAEVAWDLDVCYVVGDVARQALELLGRP